MQTCCTRTTFGMRSNAYRATGQKFLLWDYHDKLTPAEDLAVFLKLKPGKTEARQCMCLHLAAAALGTGELQKTSYHTAIMFSAKREEGEANFGGKQHKRYWVIHRTG